MSRKYLKLYSLFCLIVFLPSICLAQATVNTQWRTIESPKKDLSFDVPENFLVNKGSEEQEIFAFHNNVVMNVTVIKNKDIYKSYRNIPHESETKVSRFKLDDFIGDVHTTEKGKKISIAIYTVSSEAFYSILFSSKNSSNPSFGKFIGSLKLRGKPLFEQKNPPNETNLPKISIETLETSPIILEALKAKDAKKNKDSKKDEVKYEADDNKEIEDENNYSRPLIVLRKPQPRYTDSARQSNVSGTVKLKVKFQSDCNVGDIVVLSKLDKSLERNAIEAAKNIKFLPAEIDGKPTDSSKKITYNFVIY